MSQINFTTSITTPRSESDDSRPTAMAIVNAAWRERYSPVPILSNRSSRIRISGRVGRIAIPSRPLEHEIWFNIHVMEPISCCLAPPPAPMGVLKKKYLFLEKPKLLLLRYALKDKRYYHTVMSKDSKRRRRTLGSQASREKWKNKLHARRMKATVRAAAAATAAAAPPPSSVRDPAPPAVDQKELLGSGYEQCASTGRIVCFSRRQRAKALA